MSEEKRKDAVQVTVEFSGGLEMLFEHQRKLQISMAKKGEEVPNVAELVSHLCNDVMKDSRKDLFVLDGTVRPGILVLINDADWELEGEDQYELQEGDNILFVSTLHGG
ncbi:ubiquitin related modifier 1 [Lophiostoma macrostomum CBS 122681]|uniref:Ubiquitin-related modifier 1 n=1 Tax=Lophiostoma macrostomum CBS 122681 TaxID=1314788 RepID=A0A6A6T2T7_9PLEO|nr:ubiquitin related modifier 1 [Lophiostoma macrostomum CBS 122681]